MSHKCDNLIISCIDFRSQKLVDLWLHDNFELGTYDSVCLAGAVKDLKKVMEQVETSVNLHHIKKVFLITHEDCGAYSPDDTSSKQDEDLNLTKTKILESFPSVMVESFFLHLDGDFEKI